jgi:hypothetical protein
MRYDGYFYKSENGLFHPEKVILMQGNQQFDAEHMIFLEDNMQFPYLMPSFILRLTAG